MPKSQNSRKIFFLPPYFKYKFMCWILLSFLLIFRIIKIFIYSILTTLYRLNLFWLYNIYYWHHWICFYHLLKFHSHLSFFKNNFNWSYLCYNSSEQTIILAIRKSTNEALKCSNIKITDTNVAIVTLSDG